MTAEIITFKKTTLDTLLEYLKEDNPDEIVLISFKKNKWEVLSTEIESGTKFLGALVRIQNEIQNGENNYD